MRTYEADEVDAMIAKAIARDREQRPAPNWVGLTDEEIETEWVMTPQSDYAEGIWFGRRIEALLKEKNA